LDFSFFVVVSLRMVKFRKVFNVGLVRRWCGCSRWSRGFCAVVLQDQTFV
jgi:hypothetical protein